VSTLWLLRHAQVDCAPGQCYGASDVPALAEATRDAAVRAARVLPADVPLRSSPLQRCTDLAQALRPAHALITDARLAEMNFGGWEGGPWSAIARHEFDAWTADFGDGRAGGHGESTRQFMARVGTAFEEWRAAGEDAIWVTHAGVMRAVLLWRAGTRHVVRADQWPSQQIGFGEVLRIDLQAPSNPSAQLA